MSSNAYYLFFEEFIFEMKQQDQNLSQNTLEQLAKKKWQELDPNQKGRYSLMAINELKPEKNEEQALQFQINYCSSSSNYKNEAENISNLLSNLAENIKIDIYRVPGECGSISLFLVRNNGRSQLIWHSLKEGFITQENESILISKVRNYLKS